MVADVVKPLKRVVLEFEDGSALDIGQWGIQRQELFTVHRHHGILAVSLAISTAGDFKTKRAEDLLVQPEEGAEA